MASMQETVRSTLDTWTLKEQLCLASIVLKSENKDWATVSKSLKEVIGQNGRLSEKYSSKNCALQYRYLLDNNDTAKKKKRMSENMECVVVDPATNKIVKKLNDERIEELKSIVKKEKEEYDKLMNDLKVLESDGVSKEQLSQIWNDLSNEDQEEISCLLSKEKKSDTTEVDMDVDETLTSTKTSIQIPSQATGTSPLLSSLLKSPTTTMPPQNVSGVSSARVTAPTITTLLTSGSIPSTNQPTITLKSHIPPQEAAHLLTRPISGPPGERPSNVINKSVLSPSQTAPTLSMLLEKSKNQPVVYAAAIASPTKETKEIPIPKADKKSSQTPTKESLSNMGTSPSENVKAKTPTAESEEADLTDEQQLLDVFGNIGDIDELVADVAAVINDEGVDEVMESIMEAKDDTDNQPTSEEIIEKKEAPDVEQPSTSLESVQSKVLDNKNIENIKVESTLSDDSIDDLPLATVANLKKEIIIEKKEVLTEGLEIPIEENITKETNENESLNTIEDSHSPKEEEAEANESSDAKKENSVFAIPEESSDSIKQKEEVELSESETNAEQTEEEKEELSTSIEKGFTDEKEMEALVESLESPTEVRSSLEFVEEDKTKERSRNTEKDELYGAEETKASVDDEDTAVTKSAQENISSNAPVRPPALRKLRDRDRSESPLVDDDTTASDVSTSNLKTNQRCPSTPNIDSIPNSPVNSITSSEHEERRETRGTSKKSLLSVYNSLQPHKYIGIFQRIFEHESHQEICNNPMDFIAIKKNIEMGLVKTLNELQHDVLLMCTNALMLTKTGTANYQTILTFKHEVQCMKEFVSPTGNSDSRDSRTNNSTVSFSHQSKRGRKKNSF